MIFISNHLIKIDNRTSSPTDFQQKSRLSVGYCSQIVHHHPKLLCFHEHQHLFMKTRIIANPLLNIMGRLFWVNIYCRDDLTGATDKLKLYQFKQIYKEWKQKKAPRFTSQCLQVLSYEHVYSL